MPRQPVPEAATRPSEQAGNRVAVTDSAPTGEIRALTGLRLFAALWVVLFHFQFTPGAPLAAVLAPLAPFIGLGALGVDLFFVLSGFVIGLTYLDRLGAGLRLATTRRYLWTRLCRIWPVYAVVTTVFGVVVVVKMLFGTDGQVTFQAVQPEVSVSSWLQQMLMIQTWTRPSIDGSSWVGPAWSLSAEWLAYLLFPLTALIVARIGRLPGWLLGGIAVGLLIPMAVISATAGSPYFPFSWLVRVLTGFLSGVLAYLVVRRLARSDQVRRWASRLSWLTLLGIVGGLWLGAVLGGAQRGGAVIVLFPVLIGALALADRGPARLLATPWATHGGRISYSLYLAHIAIFEVYWAAIHRIDALAAGDALAIAVAVAVLLLTGVTAHLLWRHVEEPARSRLRQQSRTGRHHRRDATPPVPAAPGAGAGQFT